MFLCFFLLFCFFQQVELVPSLVSHRIYDLLVTQRVQQRECCVAAKVKSNRQAAPCLALEGGTGEGGGDYGGGKTGGG